jgi:hypothetical protein
MPLINTLVRFLNELFYSNNINDQNILFSKHIMNLFKARYTIIFYSLLCGFPSINTYAQKVTIIIKGTVTDAETEETLPFAGVELVDKNVRTSTNLDGQYSINSKGNATKIRFSCIGYETQTKSISPGKSQIIDVQLKPSVTTLDAVVVRPTKIKYKNKANPAVELIEKVIENRDKNRKEELNYYSYEKYEKILLALSNYGEKLEDRKILKKFKFIFDNADSTKIAGSKILPAYLKETLSDYYYRKAPKANKEIIKANKMVNYEGYLDNRGMMAYLKYLYQDINIYDNSISFLSNQFLSPIANTGPAFYKYFILDTTVVDSFRCIKLLFAPRNKTDMLFRGFMYITLDSSFAVKGIDMSVNKDINLDWVKDINIVQQFEKIDDKGWFVSSDEVSIDFGIGKNSTGVFGQRTVSHKNYKINKSELDSVYKGQTLVINDDADSKNKDFWEIQRHQPLSKSEQGIYSTVDSMNQMPAFKRAMDVMMLLFTGYLNARFIELGPVSTFLSYNPIEGYKLRIGGRTTPRFSKKINFESYIAYGYTDQKYKYYFGTTYSLTPKTIYEFPVKSIKLSYQDETQIPGQNLQFTQPYGTFLSIKRGVNDKLYYNKTFVLEHLNEFANHFSYTIGYHYIRQTPAGNLFFNPYDYLSESDKIPYINISEMYLNLRYAPNEKFYQGKIYRYPFHSKYPVFQLNYAIGSKLLNNDYNYQDLNLSISKRFYPWILGYSDVTLQAGKIFGKVPYPLLVIHNANQTYSYDISSYNLMNFLEFVSDQYSSLNIDHCFNGFIFNKIPIIKKLKWREVMSCKVLYGSLSNLNNPENQTGLFKFPVNNEGKPITYTLEKMPYIEASVGISNILKLFRVDLIKRFTYLDHPNVSSLGVRVLAKIDF